MEAQYEETSFNWTPRRLLGLYMTTKTEQLSVKDKDADS